MCIRDSYRTVEKIDVSDLKNVRDINKNFDKIIVSVHKSDKSPFDNYKLSPKEISIINTLKKYNNVVLVVFSNPYTLLDINLNGFDSVMLAYQNSPIFQKKASLWESIRFSTAPPIQPNFPCKLSFQDMIQKTRNAG